MKIITMSDIHGDFDALDRALEVVQNSGADVLTINGDLAGSVFEGEEKGQFKKDYAAVRNTGAQIYRGTNGRVNSMRGFAKFLLSNNVNADEKLMNAAKNYLDFEGKAEEKMMQQYTEFKGMIKNLNQRVFLIPGNWDGKCIDDVLANENISNKTQYNHNGISFIGYGGSYEAPVEMPEDILIRFDEDEAFNHLSQFKDAEISLMHANPRGFDSEGYKGVYSLLAYMSRNTPSLILTGHSHEPKIIKDGVSGTVIVNPGKLGRYNGDCSRGFVELDIDEKLFVSPIAYYSLDKNHSIKRQELKRPW